MTKYLNTRPGSIEEVVSNMTKDLRQDSAYQDMFKKELEKAGKGIGAMTPAEKKAFFNKIDKKYSAKNEEIEEGKMSQIDQMQKDGKSAEEIAKMMKLDVKTVKSILGEMASDKAYAIGMSTAKKKYDDEPPLEKKTITKGHEIAKKLMKKETQTYTTMKMNQMQKDAGGEKEPQKIKENTFAEVVKNMWQKSAEEIEEVKEKSKYLKAKADVSKTMVDTEKTKIDTKPEVSYDK